jgi:hypothetical protein
MKSILSLCNKNINFVCWLLLCAAIGLSAGSVKHTQKKPEPLAAIPSALRAAFVERLKLLVEYQSTGQWDKMYDLMPSSILQGMSKEEFVNHRQKLDIDPRISTLIDFTPTESSLVGQTENYGQWTIPGCAEYKRNGRTVHIKAGMAAELEKDKWFFTEVAVSTQIDGPEQPCAPVSKKKRVSM